MRTTISHQPRRGISVGRRACRPRCPFAPAWRSVMGLLCGLGTKRLFVLRIISPPIKAPKHNPSLFPAAVLDRSLIFDCVVPMVICSCRRNSRANAITWRCNGCAIRFALCVERGSSLRSDPDKKLMFPTDRTRSVSVNDVCRTLELAKGGYLPVRIHVTVRIMLQI